MSFAITSVVIIILIIAGIGYAVWRYMQPETVRVVVRAVKLGDVEKTVSNTRAGTVKACRRAKLSPGIGGQIAKLPIKEGDRVREGQLLMELWNDDIAAELRLAETEAEAAKARAKAVCERAGMTQRDAGRLSGLYQKGAVSEDRADKAVSEARAVKAECAAAEASVHTSRARIGVIRTNIERTRLLAPFDGIIAAINGELNEYVTPSPIGIVMPPAVDLIDNTCFYVTAPIDEVDAPLISPGMTARITIDAFGGKIFDGTIRRIDAYVLDLEKQARTVGVEASFVNPSDISHLLAGYSADIDVIIETRKNTLRIPAESVLDGKKVFVFSKDQGVISVKTVTVGISNWDYSEVVSGLSAGDFVVVNADQAGVRDGAKAVISEENR